MRSARTGMAVVAASMLSLTASLLVAQPPEIPAEPDIPAAFGFEVVQVQQPAKAQAGDQQPATETKSEPPAQPDGQAKSSDPAPAVSEDKPAADTPDQPAGNPLLKKLIQGILPKPDAGRIVPLTDTDELIPVSGDRADRDSVDALAPELTKLANALAKAREAFDQGRPDQGLQLLQQVLDFPEDSLVRLKSGQAASIRVVANRLLGRLDRELLDRYRLEHGATAQQLLDEAMRDGSIKRLAEVGTRFFHTEAGYEAANRLGTLHLDRGEFGMAARWYSQLIEARTPLLNDPRWRLKAALAFREARNPELTQKLLNEALAGRSVEVGGQEVGFEDWLATVPGLKNRASDPLDDWTQLYGTASRNGQAEGSEPVLLERWNFPLTENLPLQEQIGQLVQDLDDQRRAVVPAWFPTLVNGRVAIPTLRGVRILDAESGAPLWTSREGVSAEMLLTGDPSGSRNGYRIIGGRMIPVFQSGGVRDSSNADRDPLTSLMFRDGVYGLTSSDGRQLFVIEELAILSQQQPGYSSWSRDPALNDPFRRSWSTNKLVSYDLESGRPRWEVGGTRLDEDFDLPLAGNFFFGVPAIDGESLFVVGENAEREIRVFSIDSATGQPQWSQLIGYSDASIDRDQVRRWWTAQVGVDDGIVVCPTTIGWLVAVDRLNHSLLWAYRYSRPGSENQVKHGSSEQASLVDFVSLNSRWAPSAPIIVNGKVLYSPYEESALICLDLLTGEKLWQFPKREFLYVAGVHDNMILLVGTNSAVALSLENGTTRWTAAIDTSDGRPSGRAILTDEHLMLPLSGGQLWRINLDNGTIDERLYLPDDAPPLGNLAMYRGLLLSLSPHGVTAYEQRRSVETQIATRQQQNPEDPQALLLQAALERLNRDYPAALQLLRKVDANGLPTDRQLEYRRLMFQTLADVVRSDPAAHNQELQDMQQWADSPSEEIDQRRLASQLAVANGRLSEALDIYLNLAGRDSGELIRRNDEERVRVQLQSWLRGKLLDLWTQAGPEERQQISDRISPLVAEPADGRVDWIRLLSFHPLAQEKIQELLRDQLDRQQLVQAESWLADIDESGSLTQQASARMQLAQAFIDRRMFADAEVLLRELETTYGEIAIPEGTTAADFVARSRQIDNWQELSEPQPIVWQTSDVEMTRSGPDYTSHYIRNLDTSTFRWPANQALRFELHQQYNRLTISNALNDSIVWSVPLQGDQSRQAMPAAHESGHGLVILHKETLYLLSPQDRQMVWSVPVDVQAVASGSRYYGGNQNSRFQFQKSTGLLQSNSVLKFDDQQPESAAVAIGSDFVCYETRRGVACVSLADGGIRWTHQGLGARTRILASNRFVFLVPEDRSRTQVLRAVDGQPVEVANIGELLAKTSHFVGDSLVLLESVAGFSLFGLGNKRAQIRCLNPFTKETDWTLELPSNTALARISDDRLLALTDEGVLSWVDLRAGKFLKFGQLPADQMEATSELFQVAADHHHLYLVGGSSRYYGGFYSEVESLAVSGRLWCVDRVTGDVRWNQPVEKRNLILDQLSHSPLVVLAAINFEQRGNFGFSTMNLTAIDKRTGNRVVDDKLPTSGFRSFEINMAERYVEVRTYNSRLRMMATDQLKAESR